jgi:hypothetical protein
MRQRPAGAEGEQALHGCWLVGDGDVQVHAVLAGLGLGGLLQEQLGIAASGSRRIA